MHPKSTRGGVDRVCEVCGLTFVAKSSEVRLGHALYCSRICQDASWHQRLLTSFPEMAGVPRKPGHTAPRSCEECTTLFWTQPRKVAAGQGRYCSRVCDNEQRRRVSAEYDALWPRVDKSDGCWMWTGAVDEGGYGVVAVHRVQKKAHRVAYEQLVGPIPDGLNVCHDCDKNYPPGDISYRRCVRPDHLWLGTDDDNAKDKAAKGRASWGERHGWHKLTASDVREMRRLRDEGTTLKVLATRFGVGETAIARVISGETWARLAND